MQGLRTREYQSPYSTVSKSHGRKAKFYELEVACSKLGLQTEDYKKYISI